MLLSKRAKTRQVFLIGLFFFLLIYYFIDTINDFAIYIRLDASVNYFVNTTGCHMAGLTPLPMSVLPFMAPEPLLNCTRRELLSPITIDDKHYLHLNLDGQQIRDTYAVSNISEIVCTCIYFERLNDQHNKYAEEDSFRLDGRTQYIGMPAGVSMVRIRCKHAERKEPLYHDVHFFVTPPKPQAVPAEKLPKRLSVMILGIDSISHMHYLRSMTDTAAFIGRLPHVEFWGYNRVGHNSYPNLVPLLSGLSEQELEQACVHNNTNYDQCPLLWKDFKAAGYNTSLGEDGRVSGTFNYGKSGFQLQPTDFYLRPVMLEIDAQTRYSIDKQELVHCSGRRLYSDVLHEFIYKLLPHMQQSPFFSFFWRVQGVHDYFGYARQADAKVAALLKQLEASGIMQHTLILLMSDHGLRLGPFRASYEGMLEESQPLLVAIYPKWLAKNFPAAVENFKRNAHSLVTTYDLHATLKDLLELYTLHNQHLEQRSDELLAQTPHLPRGISLFLPIPEVRDCDMAGIPAEFCLCQRLKQISPQHPNVKRAARFVVSKINDLLQWHRQCELLQLAAVLMAYKLERDHDKYMYEIRVRVRTTPGDGKFEGITRFTGNTMALNGMVTRINKYGNQSYCVHDYRIEMYCFCP